MEFLNTEKRVDTTEIAYIIDGFKAGTIKDGDKVKVSIRFRGRELGHPEIGLDTMNRFAEFCSESASVEKPAKMEGRNMLMFLAPKPNK